jgi:hypothetical protein
VHALDAPSLSGTSTLRELLKASLGDDAQKHAKFAALQSAHRDDPAAMWAAIQTALGADTTKRLQLDGQLAFLSGDNAPLIAKLHTATASQPMTSVADLVALGYHRASAWTSLLDGTVPRTIPGQTPDERKANYAEVLAAQVRLAFPTAVIAEEVQSGQLPLSAGSTARDAVHAFLIQQQGTFEIGMHPIDPYAARTKIKVPVEVVSEIKRLQRVYQITPNDTAMSVLLNRGLDSAYRIAHYDAKSFVRAHGAALGGDEPALAIHTRSQQIHNVTLNIATGYLLEKKSPLSGFSLGFSSDPKDAESTIIAYPTLESLVGPLDYCACEDCQTILSPAAYLVDLLQFIDVAPPDATKSNPLDVLLARRPDIATLPLSCENTNTALPYIDIVNETLEYFVKNNDSLSGYTGHDTDDAVTSAELLAAPQFTDADAYTKLQQIVFPPPLPFHQPLEALRRTFGTFEVTLHEAMETLRKDDLVDRVSPDPEYAWRDILLERLGMSRLEYGVLTNGSLTLQQLFGFASATSDADVIASISKVKSLKTQLQISYDDVVSLVETLAINPNARLIDKLDDLDIPFSTIQKVKDGLTATEQADFDALIAGIDQTDYPPNIQQWLVDNHDAIMSLVTIANPIEPTQVCELDELELRYANPVANNQLRAIDFVRITRFVRLWKKLGWTIEQTDQAITALFPATPITGDDSVDLKALDDGYAVFLVRLGIVFELIERLKLSVDKDLGGLLACFATLGTYGDTAPYRAMFLTSPIADSAFDEDAHGNMPQAPDEALLDHTETLRAAFGLTDDEFQLIVDDLGYDSSTKLSLDAITQIYRRGWLARALRISVRELLLLCTSAAFAPFSLPDPPLPPIIRLLDLVQSLASANLSPAHALYLIWNQDLSGQSAPTDDEVTQVARSLRAALAAVDVEFAAADDPTGDVARARMTLVYGSDASDVYVGLLAGTYASSVPYTRPTPLPDAVITVAGDELVYDDFRKQLTWLGVMSTMTRDALLAAAASDAEGLATAIQALYDANNSATTAFFAKYPQLAAPLDAADPPATKWTTLLAALLPDLIDGRKRQQALATVSGATDTDAAYAQAVLDDATVLHAAANTSASALDDLLSVGTVAGTAPTATWTGYIEAAESADFVLAIVTDPAATVALTFAGATVPMAGSGGTFTTSSELTLTAGTLYAIQLTVTGSNTVELRWETPSRGWEDVPAQYIYPTAVVDPLRRVYVTYLKACTLASALTLTASEIAHLAADPKLAVASASWLDALPVTGTGTPDLLAVLTALLDYAHLKATFSPDDERLLDVVEAPTALLPSGEDALITLTGWDPASLDSALARFSYARTDLAQVGVFRRVFDALDLVQRTGVSADALIAASTNNPIDASVPTALQAAVRARYDEADWLEVIKPINDELRARQRDALVAYILGQFAISTAVDLQAIDTGDKLFEYFLMDVLMDPCMLTSRIRHALSSVQLFVERCLMNLELQVAVESINADWWKWMKRYRVWEANRKVFLWPENWLEPELRDNTSQQYDEVMGNLLQSDITEDAAAAALEKYLEKLEEVAKLDPCGIHIEENASGDSDDVVHVIGCTAGAKRTYYYRRKQDLAWTPWEQVKADIEDRPVIPVVWNGRVFAFWLRVVTKNPSPAGQTTTKVKDNDGDEQSLSNVKPSKLKKAAQDDAVGLKAPVHALLCFSEYKDGKWTAAKTSDTDDPLELGEFTPSGDSAFDRSSVRLRAMSFADPNGDDDELAIIVSGTGVTANAHFVLYNTHASPDPDVNIDVYLFVQALASRRTIDTQAGDTLSITYEGSHLFGQPTMLPRDLLTTTLTDRSCDSNQAPLAEVWDSPFFYRDGRHVFYVTTSEQVVTVAGSNGYGPVVTTPNKIPGLVFEVDPYAQKPDPAGPVEAGRSPGIGESAAMQAFVGQSATLKTGVGTLGSVRFDGVDIGATGVLAGKEAP